MMANTAPWTLTPLELHEDDEGVPTGLEVTDCYMNVVCNDQTYYPKGVSKEHAEEMVFAVNCIAWLQSMHNLHTQVEILYVVDGYTVTLTWDDEPMYVFKGETLHAALMAAMVARYDSERRRFVIPRLHIDYKVR
jgi:hypothetical protein